MKKALILLLAFAMIVSAGMGFGAAATPSIGDATSLLTNNLDQSQVSDDNSATDDPGNSEIDPNKEKTIITIIAKQEAAAVGAAAAAGSGAAAAGAKNAAAQKAAAQKAAPSAAAAQTVPMQKTGLPILPGVLSTLMVGSGLLYGRLRN